MINYKDLGFNGFGIKTISSYVRDTPAQTRASSQPGTIIADGLYIGVNNNVLKIDKDGILLGNVVPAYEESRLYYSVAAHKLFIGGVAGWEEISSS